LSAGFGAGILAWFLISILLALTFLSRLFHFNPSLVIGSLLTGRYSPGTWWFGFFLLAVASGLVGIFYAFILGQCSSRTFLRLLSSAAVAFAQWLVTGVYLRTLFKEPAKLPDYIAQQDFFDFHADPGSAFVILILHLIYGIIIGLILHGALEVTPVDDLSRVRPDGLRHSVSETS
jgi:hypothetical protein